MDYFKDLENIVDINSYTNNKPGVDKVSKNSSADIANYSKKE